VEHLFLDSLLFLRVVPPEARSILDFGAGAGLPGIPIAIVRAEARVTLLEGRRRRASFLSTCARELALTGVRVLAVRAEAMTQELGGSFDAVVMRCAGRLDDAMPMAAQFARAAGGLVVAAGPPKPIPLRIGQWHEVPGAAEGTTRRFAVFVRGQ
jgi:16S rRNA (guanine527-N7)-methyltransferase